MQLQKKWTTLVPGVIRPSLAIRHELAPSFHLGHIINLGILDHQRAFIDTIILLHLTLCPVKSLWLIFLPSFKRFFFIFFQYIFHLFKNSVFAVTRLVRIIVFFLSNKVIFLKGGSNGFMWYLRLILVFLLKQCIIKLYNFLKMSFHPVVLMMHN